MVLTDGFQLAGDAQLGGGEALALREGHARRAVLHRAPQLAAAELLERFPLPGTEIYFQQPLPRNHLQPQDLSQRLGSLQAALQRAGIHRFDGRLCQRLCQLFGLLMPFFVQAHVRQPPGQTACGDVFILGVADEEDCWHGWSVSRLVG